MKAFNAGNLAGMVVLYEPDAAVVSEPGGDVVSGLPALKENLEGYLSLAGQIICGFNGASEAVISRSFIRAG